MKKHFEKHTKSHKEIAMDLARRGLIVINDQARDILMTRLAIKLPTAFRLAANNLAYGAVTACRPLGSLRRQRDNDDILSLFIAWRSMQRHNHQPPMSHQPPAITWRVPELALAA